MADRSAAKAKTNAYTGDLRSQYKSKFGRDVDDALANANDASTANSIYDNIKSLKSDDFWASQDLSGLMTKAGHQENKVNIGNYTKDGGLSVNATISGGIDFSDIQSQLDSKGWNKEKNNAIGQLGSALLAADGGTETKPEPEKDTSQPASNTLTKAQSYVEAADDFRMSGGAVNQMAGDLTARDEFMENYKFNVKKRMEPGVANEYGNDALKAQSKGQNQLPADAGSLTADEQRRAKTDSYAQTPNKVSQVAASIVGKNAGRFSV